MEELLELQKFQIIALQSEVLRLNEELKKVKQVAFEVKLSDPNFDRPISEMTVNYEIVKQC